MQVMPRQEPIWADALSNLTKSVGQAAGDIGSAHFQAKNAKEFKKQEEARKEMQRVREAQSAAATGLMSYDQAYALGGTTPELQKAMIQQMAERGAFGRMAGIGGGGQTPGMEAGNLGSQTPMSNLQGLAQPQREQIPYGAMTMSNIGQSLRPEDPNAFLGQRVLQGAAAGIQPRKEEKPVAPEQQMKQEIDNSIRDYDITQGIDMNPTNMSGLMGMGMSKLESKKALDKAYEYDHKLDEKVASAKGLKPVMKRMVDLVEKDIASGGKLLRTPAQQEWLKSLEEGHSGYGGVGGALGAAMGGILGGLAGSLIPGGGTVAGAGAGAYAGEKAGRSFGEYFANTEKGRIKQETTKETQEFEKLSAEFIKGAKGIFGSRITDQDLQAFLKMVPTLSNTPDGKMAILRNLQLVNQASIVEGQIRDQIVRRNGGSIPYNIDKMVNDIAEPMIDKMADQWRKETDAILEKYSPKQQEQPNQSMIPGLPGSYNAQEI